MNLRWMGAAVAATAVALSAAPAAGARAVAARRTTRPFGRLRCRAKPTGVRFCPGNGTTDRVPSWDGVPLDADVTLPPATVKPPYPTIAMLHGWGGNKTELEFPGDHQTDRGYNNLLYARHGFAVVNYTARGEGNSCGDGGTPQAQSQTGACKRGFTRSNDLRFDARDTEYLLGKLVDEGIADPSGLGVTGWSYGGGRSYALAYLNDRTECAGAYDRFPRDPCKGKRDGSFIRWRSPHGVPLHIAAAYPRFGFSDLAYALIPNGRFLDYDPATEDMLGTTGSHSPVGNPVLSIDSFLYDYGKPNTFYERPSRAGWPWDLTTDLNIITTGGPTALRRLADQWSAKHSGFGTPGTPSPLLIEQGWTDDFFPPEEGLRVYNDYRRKRSHPFVALQIADTGHPRAASKLGLELADERQALAFFTAKLKHRRGGPRSGSVTAFTQTCPSVGPHPAPDGGPFHAKNWARLHPGVVVLHSNHTQRVLPGSGDPAVAAKFDPVSFYFDPHTQLACTTVPAQTAAGTATYTLKSKGFTLMGLPTIVAKVTIGRATADPGQLDARLWDVSPGGTQLLVTRTGYRLSGSGSQRLVFQLHGNGYRFKRGHTIKLELLGQDAPYYRPSAGGPGVTIHSLTMVMPTLERPNGSEIRPPASVPLPAPGERHAMTTQGVAVRR